VTLSKLKDAWYRFCVDNTSLDNLTVIFSEELAPGTSQGPRPAKPYLTLRFSGPMAPSPTDDFRYDAVEEKFELSGLREYTVSIQVFGIEAMDCIAEIQTKLSLPEVTEFFASHKAQIGIVDRGSVMNVTELLDTGFEARAAVDVRFYTTSDDPEGPIESTEKSIGKVEYDGTVTNGKTQHISGDVEEPT